MEEEMMRSMQETIDSMQQEIKGLKEEVRGLVAATGGDSIDSEQAARMLGIQPATLRNYVFQGMIGSYKVGRRVMFDRKEVLRFMRSRRRRSNEEIEREVDTHIVMNRLRPGSHRLTQPT